MAQNVSRSKTERIQLKLDVKPETREALRKAASETGYSMSTIFELLVKYQLVGLHIEEAVRRNLLEFSRRNKEKLNLSKRQKKVIEDVVRDEFTKDLL